MKEVEITKNTYDSISKDWETKRSYNWKPVKEFLESFENKKNLKLLDLGCGTGRDLELAEKLGFEKNNCIGCDFSKGQLKIVKEKGFETKIANMAELPFEKNGFDVIVCVAAFHHLISKDTQKKALEEMKRILKSNGKLLLVNWFPEKDFVEKQVEKGKFEFVNEKIVKVTYTYEKSKFDRYYYLFEEQELIELCEKEFEVVSKEYFKGNLYLVLS
ncbi:MAG: class I SAM-dependent methyltransferase [Nanoarchaeota archaeon]